MTFTMICTVCTAEYEVIRRRSNYCPDCRKDIKRLKARRRYVRKSRRSREKPIARKSREAKYDIDDIELLDGEIFKLINGTTKYYISNKGRVFSAKSGFINKKKGCDRDGYIQFTVYSAGRMHLYKLHKALAEHFIENPKPDEYICVDHINRDKRDNRLENLRWCSYSINNNNKDCVINRRGCVYRQSRGGKRPWLAIYYSSDLSTNKKFYKSFATEEEAESFLDEHAIISTLLRELPCEY